MVSQPVISIPSTNITHARFCCNRRSAALAREASFVKREAQDGKSVSVSLHARYEIRFTRNALSGDFATNRRENADYVRQTIDGINREINDARIRLRSKRGETFAV